MQVNLQDSSVVTFQDVGGNKLTTLDLRDRLVGVINARLIEIEHGTNRTQKGVMSSNVKIKVPVAFTTEDGRDMGYVQMNLSITIPNSAGVRVTGDGLDAQNLNALRVAADILLTLFFKKNEEGDIELGVEDSAPIVRGAFGASPLASNASYTIGDA